MIISHRETYTATNNLPSTKGEEEEVERKWGIALILLLFLFAPFVVGVVVGLW
jgi:hypothetical protein